jgi:uncharacterized membrane protein HdeD (DUF308 family)
VAIEWLFVAFLLCGGGYALAAALGRKSCNTAARVVLGVWAAASLVTCLLLVQFGSSILGLTAVLAGYFVAQGLLAISTAFAFSRAGKLPLMLLSGIVSLVLGWIVYAYFAFGPAHLTLAFGANLIFAGLYFLSISPVSGDSH